MQTCTQVVFAQEHLDIALAACRSFAVAGDGDREEGRGGGGSVGAAGDVPPTSSPSPSPFSCEGGAPVACQKALLRCAAGESWINAL